MARRDKYNRLKPEVSPWTIIISVAVFIALLLPIVLSIPTKKQKFNQSFDLEKKNNFQLVNQKKMINDVTEGKDVIVILNGQSEQNFSFVLIREVQKAYNREGIYETNKVSDFIPTIYYIDLKTDEKSTEALSEFLKEHEVKNKATRPIMLAFSNKELVTEFDLNNFSEELEDEEKRLVRNVKLFFTTVSNSLESKVE